MKLNPFWLFLFTGLLAVSATAQSLDYRSEELAREKRYEPLDLDGTIFLIDSSKGDLWTFNTVEKRWDFVGSPRRANTERIGTYRLLPLKDGGLLILETSSGEAWWTDGKTWATVDDPEDRFPRDKE